MTPRIGRMDAFQRRHPAIGFPIAVVYKYFDDQGPYLAAIISYYAFIAIFPLLLLG
ncbi:MAG: rane protein, partial [Nocardioidaceae bacterium]|nr:rane protein [Nocardioidaceae bacterium]